MRASTFALPFVFAIAAACGREVATKEFERVQERVCACKDQACATAFVADVKHLRTLGSEPEDATKAKAALDAALGCATKLVPDIASKLDAAF